MSSSVDTKTTTLTPSETVLFHGEQFARELGGISLNDTGYKSLVTDKSLSSKELARAVLATAFLANEQAGTLKLEVRSKKAWLGLRTVQALYAEPTGKASPWPGPSFEAEILDIAGQRQAAGKNDVEDIVYSLLGEDASSPALWALTHVHQRLNARGLLETEERRQLKLFKTTVFVLPESTRALAEAADSAPFKAQLSSAEQRGEMWKLLQAGIEKALNRRTESDSDGPDFD